MNLRAAGWKRAFRWAALGAALGGCAVACGSSSGSNPPPPKVSPIQAVFAVPSTLGALSGEHFYDHPWPSDLRRDAHGFVDWAGFPNPTHSLVIGQYIDSTKELLDGFSPAAAGYLRFTGDIDPSSLPATPPDALSPGAALQLVDVDPGSPERGKRRLVQWYWRKDAGVYWVKDTLAVQPALGYPLLPKTRYAYVVTTGLKDPNGLPIQPSAELLAVLGRAQPSTPAEKSAAALYAPAVAELARDGVAASMIAHLAVFTTTDPTAELIAVRKTLLADFPAPTVDDSKWVVDPPEAEGGPTPFLPNGTGTDFDVYESWYGPAPNYQAGKLPFTNYGDGGGFVIGKDGKAVLQSKFQMRFTLVVPNQTKCPMPALGYPIVLYAHGTGGDYRSIVEEGDSLPGQGLAPTSIGDGLAQHCLASMGVDQIDHGARPGAPTEYFGPNETDLNPNYQNDVELLFFNLNNPIAARTNGREGAIDVVQQARLFTASHASIPPSVSLDHKPILFDASRLLFFGHSQGGLNGPLFLAVDDQARGGVLSGSGSMITIALLEKVAPVDIPKILSVLIGLSGNQVNELNLFHPAFSLAQSIIDVLDPIHYVGHIIQHPLAGFAPKSIYQTEGTYADGLGDDFAPPQGIEVESVALGLPVMAPPIHPIAADGWGGLKPVTIPAGGLSGNLAGGKASGLLAQFKPSCATMTVPCPDEGNDGHYVVFDVPACHEQAAKFCANLAADPVGRVPALGQ